MCAEAVPRDALAGRSPHRKEPIMSQHPDLVQAVARQRQAELAAAAVRHRLARRARSARGAVPGPLPHGGHGAARRPATA
jgi:hypothetical protein